MRFLPKLLCSILALFFVCFTFSAAQAQDDPDYYGGCTEPDEPDEYSNDDAYTGGTEPDEPDEDPNDDAYTGDVSPPKTVSITLDFWPICESTRLNNAHLLLWNLSTNQQIFSGYLGATSNTYTFPVTVDDASQPVIITGYASIPYPLLYWIIYDVSMEIKVWYNSPIQNHKLVKLNNKGMTAFKQRHLGITYGLLTTLNAACYTPDTITNNVQMECGSKTNDVIQQLNDEIDEIQNGGDTLCPGDYNDLSAEVENYAADLCAALQERGCGADLSDLEPNFEDYDYPIEINFGEPS
jgi:hypothetical protein